MATILELVGGGTFRPSSTGSVRASALTLATVGDPEGTRAITSIIALLVALGVALVMVAIWLRRATRPDPEVLAPLEVMGERSWRRRDPVWQRRRLDELRPAGARPLEPSVAPPEVDEAFDRGPSASGFDDLHGDERAMAPSSSNGTGDHAADAVAEDAPAAPPAAAPSPVDWPAPAPVAAGPDDATPEGAQRFLLDDLPDTDLDHGALAAALDQLDVELRSRSEGGAGSGAG